MTKEELKIKIGKKIVLHRKLKGWTQSDLARACYKDRQAIEKLENGKVNPTLFSLYELSEAMQIPLKNLTDI